VKANANSSDQPLRVSNNRQRLTFPMLFSS